MAQDRSSGVSFAILERLDAIVGAFQRGDGAFGLWMLAPSTYQAHMRDTRSHGSSAGKVGIVSRQAFRDHGTAMGTVRL